MQNCT